MRIFGSEREEVTGGWRDLRRDWTLEEFAE